MPGIDAIARERMVTEQVELRGITNPRVIEAMEQTPRHLFVPADLQREAYDDRPLPIGCGQTISQPYMVALMTEALDLKDSDRVLEIGTGSGYQAALLGALAWEVITIERHPDLAKRARDTLQRMGITNVKVLQGDGSQGLPAHAPYDAIIVTAGGPRVPKPLLRQLAVGGRLVCPAGDRKVQQLYKVIREEKGYRTIKGTKCVFVPLLGAEGWSEESGGSA